MPSWKEWRGLVRRRVELTKRLDRNIITLNEAKELQQIVTQEFIEATKRHDDEATVSIAFLGFIVSAVITGLLK